MGENNEKEPGLHSWERKLLIVAFGAWAAVVGVYGQATVNRVDKLVTSMEDERRSQSQYQLLVERRLTALEKESALYHRWDARRRALSSEED